MARKGEMEREKPFPPSPRPSIALFFRLPPQICLYHFSTSYSILFFHGNISFPCCGKGFYQHISSTHFFFLLTMSWHTKQQQPCPTEVILQ